MSSSTSSKDFGHQNAHRLPAQYQRTSETALRLQPEAAQPFCEQDNPAAWVRVLRCTNEYQGFWTRHPRLIDDIIAVHGPRPPLSMDQRNFRGALVVLSATPVGDELMALADRWAASCDPVDTASPVACDTLCPGFFFEVLDTVYDVNGEPTFPIIGGVCLGGTGTGVCDPLNQQECGEGKGCFGRERTTCQPAGDLAMGETCYPLGIVCEAGTECIGIQGEEYSYRQPYCDLNGDGPNSCAMLCPGGAWNYGDYSICIPA